MHVRPGDRGVSIPKDLNVVMEYGGPSPDGPDIVLVRLPEIDVGPIERGNVFYNLERRRDRVLDESRPAVWAKYGAPGEHVSRDDEARMWTMGISMYGQAEAPARAERDGYDYADVPSPHDGRDGHPRSYEGLSGSGLWVFTRDETTDRWDTNGELAGIAFYQEFDPDVVRYHGRSSIYTILDRAT